MSFLLLHLNVAPVIRTSDKDKSVDSDTDLESLIRESSNDEDCTDSVCRSDTDFLPLDEITPRFA